MNLSQSAAAPAPAAGAAAVAAAPAASAPPSSAFWLRLFSLTLRPGQSRKIPVVFSPMTPGPHRCAIVAMERGRRSEVVWEVAGTADMPPPIARLAERVPSGTAPVTLLLRVPPINAQREGAAESVLDARVRRRALGGEGGSRPAHPLSAPRRSLPTPAAPLRSSRRTGRRAQPRRAHARRRR